MSNVSFLGKIVDPKIRVDCAGFDRGREVVVAMSQTRRGGRDGVDVLPLLGLNAALSLSLSGVWTTVDPNPPPFLRGRGGREGVDFFPQRSILFLSPLGGLPFLAANFGTQNLRALSLYPCRPAA